MKRGNARSILICIGFMTIYLSGCGVAASDAGNESGEKVVTDVSAGTDESAATIAEPEAEGNHSGETEAEGNHSKEPGAEGNHLGETEEDTMKIIINGKEYTATLDQGKAAQELRTMLPITLTMQELNGNEKYGNLSESLTQDVYSPKEIRTGDLLLWGSDTLVLFYKDFSTPYSYTKIGRIDDPEGLKDAVGKGQVEVTFQ